MPQFLPGHHCCCDTGCPLDPDVQADIDTRAASSGEPSVNIALLSGCYELIVPEWEAPGCCNAGYAGSHLLLNNLTYPVSSLYDAYSPTGAWWMSRKASPNWPVKGNPGSFSIHNQDPDACVEAGSRPLAVLFFWPGYVGYDTRWVLEFILDNVGSPVGGIARYICDTDVPSVFSKVVDNFSMCGTNLWPSELIIEPTELPS